MNKNLSLGLSLVGVAILVLVTQSVYTVAQWRQALVVQLGKPVEPAITEPGLHFKFPFLQEVHFFDRRLLEFDQEPQEILSADKKNLKVDSYSRWRIVDPLKFFQTVRDENGAADRLNDIIYSNIREVLGQFTMMEIVSASRSDLTQRIREQTNVQANKYGIEIIDVRIKRTDLPVENSKAVFRRMQTERERQAKQYRAQGEEEAVKIRSKAVREREVLLAEAYKSAQEIRGEGDAEATKVYAEAYQSDPRFYQFTRTLEAYAKAMSKDSSTTVVLEPSGFFRYLQGLTPPGR
ncbi:Modulator of FtsH protease HflC [Candidatus Magnetaquicoccaceae bacterium FCR-1]|uniref:Protein HflC n=1 Tax=Candidatus Magnetaquiglobus chichijimensis TaxID=3141448 RepID=A0ABQ0CA02_9PROT